MKGFRNYFYYKYSVTREQSQLMYAFQRHAIPANTSVSDNMGMRLKVCLK